MDMQICAVGLGPERPAAPAEKPLKGESVQEATGKAFDRKKLTKQQRG